MATAHLMWRRRGLGLLASLTAVACSSERSLGDYGPSAAATAAAADGTTARAEDGTEGATNGDEDGTLLDVGDPADRDCEADGTCEKCDAPPHTPCDGDPNELARAMGIGCPGEGDFQVQIRGSGRARGTLTTFGTTDEWDATEGERFAVLGTGYFDDLIPTPSAQWPCNDDVDNVGARTIGPHDVELDLPAPIVAKDVGPVTCEQDPTLVGTGDCSNTLEDEFFWTDTTKGAMDYTEIRITTRVPDTASSFSFDLAYFTVEYPQYYQSLFNDLFVGWLESENWTGNVSFDADGNPISLNAAFLEFKDTKKAIELNDQCGPQFCGVNSGRRDPVCDADPNLCESPELWGTCFAGHAGTSWLTTTAAVEPGEEITLVFAIFDIEDSALDSYVFLDNWRWGCEPRNPPVTLPVG